MERFRKEKYITQIQNKQGWSFRVRYKGTDKYFNEEDYLSASQCFKAAVTYRNRIMVEPIVHKDVSVRQCYEEIDTVYVLRSETRRKLETLFNNCISHKDTSINDVTRADIIADLNAMVNDYSTDAISRVLSLWKKIYGVAIAKEYIARDMTLNIRCPLSHKVKPKKRLELTNEETLETLANHLEKRLKLASERNQARSILFILFYTGMRPAEMFALDKTDIDLKAQTISITKEMGSDRDRTNVVRPCKTEMSHRIIPISDKCLPFISEAMKLTDSPVLFPNPQGEHYATKDLGERYHLLAKNIGIDFHFYQCRHTFITRLFMKGVDLKTIQEIVGQTIDATTIGYVVSDEKRRKNAVDLM